MKAQNGTPSSVGAFRKLLDAFAGEIPHVEEGDIEALHRMRVASRRLRELIPLLALDADTTRRLSRRLRRVTRRLGSVRELDVLMLLIEELEGNARYPREGLKRIGAAVLRARTAARERMAAKLPTPKLERLARKLENAAKRLESRHTKSASPTRANRPKNTWQWALDARLTRRAERAHAAIEAAGAVYLPEPLHAVRVALKKLRYTAELRTQTKRGRVTAEIKAMKTAQDLLGRLHDLEVLISWTRDAQASLFPPDLATWRELDALVRALDDDCRVLHAGYVHDRARLIAIADRLRATKPHTLHVQQVAS
ncbi:MAG TPA: CHAD domain-containing protein [Vicinamibacterales bacterium]|nr:CHAD domain-containing protein [Vicinamibacterales bacterium]